MVSIWTSVAGEVHCLLGQNGAGKSTLIKVLAGAHGVDAGTISWQGEPVTFTDPQSALDTGIATIYQELDLVDGLSVADNIFLGHEQARGGITRNADMNRAARDLLGRLGHAEIRPTVEVGSLSAAGKQIVSMARALSRHARVIVMDEPSAVLDPDEVDGLFRVVDDLRSEGTAIIYISHRLEEIRRIGDRLTVLKDGRTVAGGLSAADTPTADLITLMTGRTVSSIFPASTRGRRRSPVAGGRGPHPGRRVLTTSPSTSGPARSWGSPVWSARAQRDRRDDLRCSAGRSRLGHRRRPAAATPVRCPAAVDAGVGLCPEERKSQGLILDDAVYRNVSLASLERFSRHGISAEGEERTAARDALRSVDLRPDDPDRVARTLSGGNQQKVVLARWLLRSCSVLLLDEPTRGVDVGARAEIYALIRDLADAGVAMVVVSSDLDEVLGLSDQVLVLADGRRRAPRPQRRHRSAPASSTASSPSTSPTTPTTRGDVA